MGMTTLPDPGTQVAADVVFHFGVEVPNQGFGQIEPYPLTLVDRGVFAQRRKTRRVGQGVALLAAVGENFKGRLDGRVITV